jgi:hypothetical protein
VQLSNKCYFVPIIVLSFYNTKSYGCRYSRNSQGNLSKGFSHFKIILPKDFLGSCRKLAYKSLWQSFGILPPESACFLLAILLILFYKRSDFQKYHYKLPCGIIYISTVEVDMSDTTVTAVKHVRCLQSVATCN